MSKMMSVFVSEQTHASLFLLQAKLMTFDKKKHSMDEIRFASRRSWRPSISKLWDLIRVGAPAGLQWFSEITAFAIFVNVLLGRRFGTVPLIATGIAWQYMRISFMPTIGVGQALTSLVGRSIGAGDIDRAKRETRIATGITLAYMGTLSVIYFAFGDTLIGWFNADPEVVEIGAKVISCRKHWKFRKSRFTLSEHHRFQWRRWDQLCRQSRDR